MYIHFPHSDYFINCPAFISSLPIPPNNQPLYPDQQTHHRSFVDSKDLLSPLKEPLFFDDWAAANFKVINLISDWLAAHQSPYQILRSDPSLLRWSKDIWQRGSTETQDESFYSEWAHLYLKKITFYSRFFERKEGRKEEDHGSGGGSAEWNSPGFSPGLCPSFNLTRSNLETLVAIRREFFLAFVKRVCWTVSLQMNSHQCRETNIPSKLSQSLQCSVCYCLLLTSTGVLFRW